MTSFRLTHLSDPHLPPMPAASFRDLAGKRALGYLNWTRNRHKYHRREVLDALVADMQQQAPDHIAITGDLVNLALEAEFKPAHAWLESVGAPDRVTVIPAITTPMCASRATTSRAFGDYLARWRRRGDVCSARRGRWR
jgi:3',5'-cyclic AMP phosphodiesterase CpdA